MNQVILTGRLTKDPELRYIKESELAVTNFTIAVNREFQKDKTDFFKIVVFGKSAENCVKYLNKGRLVAVNGSLQNNNYETTNGEKRYTNEIVAIRVEFLESKNKGSNQDSSADDSENFENNQDEIPEGFTPLDDDDDEIPF